MEIEPELSLKEAAEILGVNQITLRNYILKGAIVARNATLYHAKRAVWRLPVSAVLAARNGYELQGAKS